MARGGKIKWTKREEKLMRDTVQQFNAKIERIRNTRPDISRYQPDTIDVEEAVNRARGGTREGFKEMIRHYEAYLAAGAETPVTTDAGVPTTIYQVTENRRIAENINYYKAAGERKAKQHASPYKGTMGRPKDEQFRRVKDRTQDTRVTAFDEYSRSLEERLLRYKNREYEQQYKDNYLKAIADNFGQNSRLYKLVQSMTPSELTDLWYRDAVTDITFVYDANASPTKEHINIHEQYILDRFSSYGYELTEQVPVDGYLL